MLNVKSVQKVLIIDYCCECCWNHFLLRIKVMLLCSLLSNADQLFWLVNQIICRVSIVDKR